ncbi:MAG: TIGR02206 family membrane protein [Oscillospiraceae bacterium]|nr:TIGR02206 family membrane protein [Oscillospiraceae bacterium]
MENFFLLGENLPPEIGIQMYGPEHLIWLAAGAAVCAALSLIYRGKPQSGRRRMGLVIAVIITALQLWRIIFQINAGIFSLDYLPFHLCDVVQALVLVHAIRGGTLTGEFLYCLGLPGALSALAFPDWTRYPILNIQSLQSFITHILLCAYIIMTVAGGDVRPEIKRLPKCVLMLLAFGAPVYIFNKVFGTNFFFANWPSPGSPLEPFEAFLGNPGYLLGVIPLLAVIWTFLYLPFVLARRGGSA